MIEIVFIYDKYIMLQQWLHSHAKKENEQWIKLYLEMPYFNEHRIKKIKKYIKNNNIEKLRKITGNNDITIKEMETILEETNKILDSFIFKINEKYTINNTQKRLEDEWNKNKEFVNNFFKEVIHEELTIKQTCHIVNPNFVRGGRSIHKDIPNSAIVGFVEEWENYNTVYLVHEMLHSILGLAMVNHAIMQLIADNELRIRLNKYGKYFEEVGYKCLKCNIGHGLLRPFEKIIYPYFIKFIKNKDVNIKDFIETMENNKEVKKLKEVYNKMDAQSFNTISVIMNRNPELTVEEALQKAGQQTNSI